jgi:hypothetical protein
MLWVLSIASPHWGHFCGSAVANFLTPNLLGRRTVAGYAHGMVDLERSAAIFDVRNLP